MRERKAGAAKPASFGRKLLKWTGLGVGSLVAVVILAVLVVYAASEVRFRRAYDEIAVSPLRVAATPASLERGRHIATAIGKCGDCHGEDMGGRLFIDAGPLGQVYASNLTSGRGGVMGRYSDGQLERAIRHGVDANGHALAIMPSADFWAMSDADLEALIAYLRTLPPVNREVPRTNIRALGRGLYLAGKLPLFPAELMNHTARRPAPVPAGVTVEYGKYLATIGGCTGCHGWDLAGAAKGEGPGDPPPANLTPHGELATWTEQDFFNALRTGKRPNGVAIRPPMPWQSSGKMTDDEIRAVWMYIKSVPSKPTPTE
jgi:mono/diheme cytochrome c family protein